LPEAAASRRGPSLPGGPPHAIKWVNISDPWYYRRRNTGLSRFIDGQRATPPITARHEVFMQIYRGPGHHIPRMPWRQAAVAAATSRHRGGGT
ncbi:MAG: hypothetical protein V3R98_09880, partial [Alphaproteobacteria bacterium]